MLLYQKLADYFIPIAGGIIILFFAIKGYPKAKTDPVKKRKNILGIISGCLLIAASLILVFLF